MNYFPNELRKDFSKRILKRVFIIAACIILFPIISALLIFNPILQSTGIFILCILILENLTRIGSRTFIYIYLKSNNLPLDSEDLYILGIRNVSNVLKFIIIILTGFYLYGIDITKFFTTLSIVAAAIVWGFKEFIFNFSAGMYLLFSKKLEINQYIEIDDYKGKVRDITFQTIEIKTDSGDLVHIPNHLTVIREITNCSKDNLKKIEIEISLLRDEMPLIKKIEKQLTKKLKQDYDDLINSENPIELQYKEILSKKVTFTFVINISRYTFNLENKIQQIAYSIIGELLIKYHSNEKNNKINSEE